jgi:RNA polymerase sigma factor (TIGR02999 family)
MKDDEVTTLLAKWREGSVEAQERLMQVVQSELRRLAASYLRVNEAYLRLMPQREVHWENRAHFFGIAAKMMRRVLVDHARRKHAGKREGFSGDPVSLSQVADPAGGKDIDVLNLHQALDDLARLDKRQADVVELRYFGGLKIEEIAEAIGMSPATVKRELTTATVWLRHRMKGEKT